MFNLYFTWSSSEIALLNYKHKGKGYCRRGYYKGWTQDADHAIMDEEKCAKHCNEEPDCLYFAVKPLVTCSRYNKDAGNCESDKMSSTQHELSHELYKKNRTYNIHHVDYGAQTILNFNAC